MTTHKCPCINVLCVATHKWWNEAKMGDGENWTNRKVWKTESRENLCLQFSKCRKVTTQKCFKHSHASMLKQNLGWVTRKTEPMEKFGKLNWQNFCVSGFLSVEYQCRPLWKNWKMAAISLISIIKKNFQLQTAPKFGSQFSKCWQKQNISVGHYEKIEKWLPFLYLRDLEGSYFCFTDQSMAALVWLREAMLSSVPCVAPHLPLYPPPPSMISEEEETVGPPVNDWNGEPHP